MADRRFGRKPVARGGALPWRRRALHGLRVTPPDVERRTSTDMRRLGVQERSEPHRVYLLDGMGARRREQKEKNGEKKSDGRWAAQHCASNHRVSDRGLIGKKGCFRGGNEKAKLRQRGNGAGRGHEMADAAIVVLVAGHSPRQMVVPMAWVVHSMCSARGGGAVCCRLLPIAGGGGSGGAQAGETLGTLSVGVQTDALSWHRAVVVVKGFHHQLRQQGEEKNPSQGHLTTEGAKFCGHVLPQR